MHAHASVHMQKGVGRIYMVAAHARWNQRSSRVCLRWFKIVCQHDGMHVTGAVLFVWAYYAATLRLLRPRWRRYVHVHRFTLEKPKIKCLVDDAGRSDTKLLLLDDSFPDVTLLSEELQGIVESNALEQVKHTVVLDYSYLNATQVLRKLLPPEVEVPTSFECVGHLAHLNLREEQLPYKAIIGAVMLDKNPSLKTVVNKLGSIENEYRVFPMEVVAGLNSTETEVVQHGARFRLDFAKVYWNSRLETEHRRLVGKFLPEDVVVDMMAGIGPFVVPAAKQGCTVYANDLNPESMAYLAINAKLNKVTSKVHMFNMCGRRFVRMLLDAPKHVPAHDEQSAEGMASASATIAPENANSSGDSTPVQQMPEGFRPPGGGLVFQHAVMNLPASAVEFLDAFNGAFDPSTWRDRELPKVHVYTFKKGTETEADIVGKVEQYLGGKLETPAEVYTVRDVAPNKLMLCVSFQVPKDVAFHGRGDEQPCEKRQKIV
eukprot:352421-Chlamydomonas_euryale.AAC.51